MLNIIDLFTCIRFRIPIKKMQCPICGGTLKMLFYGDPLQEIETLVYDHPEQFSLGGCDCLGDDRDPVYICSRCTVEFSNDLKQLKLITCPLEASNLIHEGECRDYVLLEKKYSYKLLEDRAFICNTICPVMGKHVGIQTKDGSYYKGVLIDTHAYARNINENFLTILNKKCDNQNEYTNILISDISKILHT